MITSAVSLDNAGRYLDDEIEAEAIDQFVARVLCRAHRSAEARNAPSEARAILDLAQMFADELIARDPAFDRVRFVEAAIEGPA